MKPKITKDLQNNDQAIAQRVYSMYYNNYKRGLQEQAQEVNGTDATNNVADIVVDPTANDKTRNTSSKSLPFSKPALVGATSGNNSNSSNIKLFLKESHLLDNELNQVITELKLNHKNNAFNLSGPKEQQPPPPPPPPTTTTTTKDQPPPPPEEEITGAGLIKDGDKEKSRLKNKRYDELEEMINQYGQYFEENEVKIQELIESIDDDPDDAHAYQQNLEILTDQNELLTELIEQASSLKDEMESGMQEFEQLLVAIKNLTKFNKLTATERTYIKSMHMISLGNIKANTLFSNVEKMRAIFTHYQNINNSNQVKLQLIQKWYTLFNGVDVKKPIGKLLKEDFEKEFGEPPDHKDIDTIKEQIQYMEQTMNFTKKAMQSATNFVNSYTPYNELDDVETAIVDIVFNAKNPKVLTTDNLMNAMKTKGYNIIVNVNQTKGFGTTNNVTRADLYNSFKAGLNAGKSRNGVNIVSKDTKDLNFSNLPLTIKIISNIIYSLIQYANVLKDNNFKGSTYNDNTEITNLYEDIADKMYILASMNKSNAQLQKVENDFEKLYKLVTAGVRLYRLPSTSGGSIHGGSLNIPSKYLYTPKKHHSPIIHIYYKTFFLHH